MENWHTFLFQFYQIHEQCGSVESFTFIGGGKCIYSLVRNISRTIHNFVTSSLECKCIGKGHPRNPRTLMILQ